VASLDADLQQVIAAWDSLPEAARKAISLIVESQNVDGD
jgi:hypothetical protein